MSKKLIFHDEFESFPSCVNLHALSIPKDLLYIHSLSSLKDEEFECSPNLVNNSKNTQDIKISPDIVYSTSGDKRPFIKVQIFGVSYLALLDTGASISVFGQLAENVWKSFQFINPHRRINIKVANDQIISNELVKKIPICYNSEEKDIEVVYTKEISFPIVLGINFFHIFNFSFCQLLSSHLFTMTEISDFSENSLEEHYSVSPETEKKLKEIMEIFLFDDENSLGCQNVIQHGIDTGSHEPIVQHQYPYNPLVLEKVHKVIDKWEQQGVIEKSKSNWRNPIVAVKKPTGEIRVCLDARKLNNITKKDRYLPPNIFESLNSIPCDVKIFGRLDKNQAFLQTKLKKKDIEKTAFYVKGRGLYHFLRMPFGLTNAPATQTRLMMEIFGDLSPYVFVYFDDIIIMAKDESQFLELLKEVAIRLRRHNITISRSKMSLFLKKIKILGHIVSADGIEVDESRLAVIKNWPIPSTKKELQRFIGLGNWYRRHIPNYSEIASPLSELLKGKLFVWSELANDAFTKLKTALTSSKVLHPPRWDRPMILLCDASDIGVGASLVQYDDDGKELVIEFYSSKLTDRERKFSPTEKECLAVIKSIIHFRPYIELVELTIITDHHSLKYLLNMKVTTGRLARWVLFLQPYVNCIQHRAGSKMKVADALSRAPILNSCDVEIKMNNMFLCSSEAISWYEDLINSIMENPVKYPNHQFNGKVLLKKLNFKKNCNNDDWREIPHPSTFEKIILEAHEDCVHGGIKKTLHKVQQFYTWPKMKKDIALWINNCIKCASVKAPNYKLTGPMSDTRIPKECMELVSIDIKGPLPEGGRQRYKYIIVIMDLLSRFAWIKLCHTVTATHIVNFIHSVFLKDGFPKQLIHDNGSQFMSHELQDYLHKNGIYSQFIPIYTAKNNPVERLNRTLGESLTLCLLDHPQQHKKWVNFIHSIVSKINNRYNEATQLTPVEVFYGYTPKVDEIPVRKLDDHHKELMNKAYTNSLKKFKWNQHYYNIDKFERDFSINDIVMIRTHHQSKLKDKFNAKLEPKFQPAKIIRKLFNNAYLCELPNGKEVSVDVSEIKNISSTLQEILIECDFS